MKLQLESYVDYYRNFPSCIEINEVKFYPFFLNFLSFHFNLFFRKLK